MARSTFAVGVIAAATSGTSVIYRVERWTLFFQSALHFTIMVCTVLPALLLSGWFELNSLLDYLAVVGLFLVTGLAIWLVMFVIFGVLLPRRQARREPSAAKRT